MEEAKQKTNKNKKRLGPYGEYGLNTNMIHLSLDGGAEGEGGGGGGGRVSIITVTTWFWQKVINVCRGNGEFSGPDPRIEDRAERWRC